MGRDLFANAPETTLSAGINSTDTSITVASSSDFPAASTSAAPPSRFRAAFVDTDDTILEYLLVTNVSGTTWTVTREYEDATRFPKASRSSGVRIVHVVTAGLVGALTQAARGWPVLDTGSPTLNYAMPGWLFTGTAAGPVGTSGGSAIGAGRMMFVPWWTPRRIRLDRIGVRVQTAATAGSLARLGIYNAADTTLLPSSLVLDAGTVAIDSTGTKEITIDQYLDPGYYWATVVPNATVTFTSPAAAAAPPLAAIFWDSSNAQASIAPSVTGQTAVVAGGFASSAPTGAAWSTVGQSQSAVYCRLNPA